MTSTFLMSPDRLSSLPTGLILQGIRWQTFQALVADLNPDAQHQLTYGTETLEISNLLLNSSPTTSEVDPRSWRDL